MVPLPGSTAALRRHSRTSDSEKGGMTMLRALLIMLALLATAAVLAFGGGLRGMGDGGLRFSAGGGVLKAEGLARVGGGGPGRPRRGLGRGGGGGGGGRGG